MDWLNSLFLDNGTSHTIFLLALAIAIGILLNRLKVGKIALGSTWILFSGLLLSHFGLKVDATTLAFIQEFGLVLFVYSIGLQVGPSFFSSFKSEGVKLNFIAIGVILLGCIITWSISLFSKDDLSVLTGVMAGAVTNTPSLGAAQQTYREAFGTITHDMTLGYAVSYPMGVVGVILVLVALKSIFKIDIKEEEQKTEVGQEKHDAQRLNVKVTNKGLDGKRLSELGPLLNQHFVVSRIFRNGEVFPTSETNQIQINDVLRIITEPDNVALLIAFFGEQVHIDESEWETPVSRVVAKRVVVTKSKLNGVQLGTLNLRSHYGVNITRVSRAAYELVATYGLRLQLGDRLTIVGRQSDVDKVTNLLGNAPKKLDIPNLLPIFLGIVFGVILGSIPVHFPGVSQPVKLGLAGGPLIVAILIGRYGPQIKLATYTTTSANLIIREIGISLFLAAVGLNAGGTFVATIVGGGYIWILYGLIITIVPTLLMGIICRVFLKMDYLTIMGVISGSCTNPPALAYSGSVTSNSRASVAYATVYPISMFMRILCAQVLILL